MLGKASLSYCEKGFDGVLNLAINRAFVENGSEAFKDGVYPRWRGLGEDLTAFSHEVCCHFDRILSWVAQE